MKDLYIITKNPGKLMVAKKIFEKYEIEVDSIDSSLPEIQAETSLEIARFAAIKTLEETGLPVVREDHSLFIHSIGIPGPFTSYVEKKIPVKKLLQIINTFTDKTGHFEIATVYAAPDNNIFEHVFKVPVTFSEESKESNASSGWGGIIKIGDEKRTIAEYPEEERIPIWSKGYEAIAKHIKKK